MSLENTLREVIRVARTLGLTGWERIMVILALSVAVLVVQVAVRGLKNIKITVETQPVVDEGGVQPPGTALPSDPGGENSFGG